MKSATPFRLRKISKRAVSVGVGVCVATLLIFVVVVVGPGNLRTKLADLLLPIATILLGGAYFYFQQHLQETKLFFELFKQFNERFDKLNKKLDDVLTRNRSDQVGLRSDEKHALFDYFNLCAEEYLCFKNGYVDDEVWQSWLAGMAQFASCPKIRELWTSELGSGSYYGFRISLIDLRRGATNGVVVNQ